MNVKELSKLFYLSQLIEREQMRLEALEDSLGLHSPGITDMPRAPGMRDKIGETVPDIADTRERIRNQKTEYELEKARLVTYIDEIDDPQVKLIVLFRFVDMMRWNDVANAIGGGNTEDSVKKICYRYLKNHE